MKILIVAGKAITLLAWAVMVYNQIQPFEGNIGTLLSILLLLTLLMHCIQLFIFRTLFKPLMTRDSRDDLSVFVFGAFSLLYYRQRLLKASPTAD